MSTKLTRKLIILFSIMMFAVLVSACAPAATEEPTASPEPEETDAPVEETDAPVPTDDEATESAATDEATATEEAGAVDMEALIAAAQEEGELTTIALPHDWCNYGGVIEGFKAKYGLTVNELNPDAGSGDELEAIRANKDNPGPQSPDVIDVGFSFGPQAKEEGLIQPYMVSTWDTIPDEAKDAEGYWYGDYYGVLSFMVNTDVIDTVPQDWADLLNEEYANSVALSGDPRVSNQAIQSVFAASLANGGSLDDAMPGLEFFADLNAAGNLVPTISNNALVARGETPIRITWDYNALSGRDTFEGNPEVEIVIPESGVFAGVYVQAISAYAPHPNAAKLWMEYLYSDEGQLLWLEGYCHPIRYNDLAANDAIPADLAEALPSAELYAKAVFPTLDQLTAAAELITTKWDEIVNADIQDAP
jgi:putative spermidine/putrescine transport system substrate-binding protein